MPMCYPRRLWATLDDTAQKFVYYVLDHPRTTHNNFYHATGLKVSSGMLYKMVNYHLIKKVGKTYGESYGNLVYTYEVNIDAVKFLEKVRSAGIEPA